MQSFRQYRSLDSIDIPPHEIVEMLDTPHPRKRELVCRWEPMSHHIDMHEDDLQNSHKLLTNQSKSQPKQRDSNVQNSIGVPFEESVELVDRDQIVIVDQTVISGYIGF